MATLPKTGSNANKGNNTAPSVLIPGTIGSGDLLIVQMTVNNVESTTAHPAALVGHELGTGQAAGQIAGHIYAFFAGPSTAGSTLTWTLSTTRQWCTAVLAYSGADPSAPVQVWSGVPDGTTIDNALVTPSITTTATGCTLVEIAVGKGNGTALGAWTAPSGWASQAQVTTGASTFSPTVVIGHLIASPVGVGTFGGQTWTNTQTFAGRIGYTLAIAPAPASSPTAGAVGIAFAIAGTVSKQASVTGAAALNVATASGDQKAAATAAGLALSTSIAGVDVKAGDTAAEMSIAAAVSGAATKAASTGSEVDLDLAVAGTTIPAETTATTGAIRLDLTIAGTVTKHATAAGTVPIHAALATTSTKHAAASTTIELGLDVPDADTIKSGHALSDMNLDIELAGTVVVHGAPRNITLTAGPITGGWSAGGLVSSWSAGTITE